MEVRGTMLTFTSIGRRSSKLGSATTIPVNGSTLSGKFVGPYTTGVGVKVGKGVLVAVGVKVKVAVAVFVGNGLGVTVSTAGGRVLSMRVVGGILIDPHPVRIKASTNENFINLIMLSSGK